MDTVTFPLTSLLFRESKVSTTVRLSEAIEQSVHRKVLESVSNEGNLSELHSQGGRACICGLSLIHI